MCVPYKSFVFRIYPNQMQKVFFEKTFGCARLVYNIFLTRRIDCYLKENRRMTYTQCARELAEMKTTEEYAFLCEVDSIALQQSLRHLDQAFQNFFKNNGCGFPKYKSKNQSKKSYTTVKVNNNLSLNNGLLRLPKIGEVKVKQHREIPEGYRLKQATVKRTNTEKYYVSLLYEYDELEHRDTSDGAELWLGLDYALHKLYVDSNGDSTSYPEPYLKEENKLRREQKKLSKMEKGSNNWKKQKLVVAKLYEKTANQRKDYLHKKSRELVENYEHIVIEDLAVKEMAKKSEGFGKYVGDTGWNTFTFYLEYKSEEKGQKIVKVDRYYPSSQLCNVCGYRNSDLSNLAIREWRCPCCNSIHDRDINAAINIRNEGIRLSMG